MSDHGGGGGIPNSAKSFAITAIVVVFLAYMLSGLLERYGVIGVYSESAGRIFGGPATGGAQAGFIGGAPRGAPMGRDPGLVAFMERCKRSGGTPTTNPATGRPSCWTP